MKRKILMTGADNAPGGVLGYINSLIAHGDHDRFSFYVAVSTVPSASQPNYVHPLGQPRFLSAAGSPLAFVRQVFRLRRLIRQEGIEVLHMHTLSAGLSGVLAAFGLRLRKIYTGHSWRFTQKKPGFRRSLFYWFEKFTCWRADEITFSTEYDLRFGHDKGLLPSTRGVIVRTRIDPAVKGQGPATQPGVRERFHIPEPSFLVGTIAHLSARKDPLTFVQIAARVTQTRPNAHFLWVGYGELEADTVALATKLGIADRLHITGMVSPLEISRYLSAMDLFLFTSRNEGVPLSVLAAQQHGLPVICSRYEGSGVEELVEHGFTGWVFEPGDDKTAAELLVDVISDPVMCRQVVERMRKRFLTLHADPRLMAKEFEAVYQGPLSPP